MANNNGFKQLKVSRTEQLHQIAAIISLVLLPLPGWPADIGLAILFTGLLRLPTTITCFVGLLKMPAFVFLVAWWLIAAISATWASHPTQNLLASPLLLLVIPALLPVLVRPRPFILALAAGTVIHTAIQIVMWLGIVRGVGYEPMTISGGLHWYPPFTSLWSTCALLLLLGLILNEKSWKYRVAPLLLAIPLPVSLVLAGTRVLFLVIPVAIVFLAVKVLMISTTRRQRVVAIAVCGGLLVVGVGTLIVPGTMPNEQIINLGKQLSTSMENTDSEQVTQTSTKQPHARFVNSVGKRYLWWRAGFDIWKKRPWIGHGNGSTKYQFAIKESEMPTKYGADVEGFLIADPHSSILTTAIEQGLLGIIFMLLFTVFAFVRAWKYVVTTPSLVGLGAVWLTIIGFSFAHTVQFSNYTTVLVTVLVAFTLCLRPIVIKASQTTI